MKRQKAQSWSDCQQIVRDLEAQTARHQRTLAQAETLRARHAFNASQGDAGARAALAQVEADERAAESELKNLRLAISQAKVHAEDARAREAAEDQGRREAERAALGDELVEVSGQIVDATRALDALCGKRAEIADEIARRISKDDDPNGLRRSRMRDKQPIGVALIAGLFEWMGSAHRGIRNVEPNALDNLAHHDCRIAGRQPPHTPPVLSAADRELQRLTKPSSFGAPGYVPKRADLQSRC